MFVVLFNMYKLGMVAHVFNPWEVDLRKFEATMVYIANSRPVRTTYRDPISKEEGEHTCQPVFSVEF